MAIEIFTIGHSNQTSEEFLALLSQYEIGELVDIRRFPGSRKFPQFDQEQLSKSLKQIGVEYQWLEALGGRRPKSKMTVPSPNFGLRNQSFRNYADYMLTDSFRNGIETLLEIAATKRTAIMCSESVFWRCHRRLVSDYLVAHGHVVQHIFPSGEIRPHRMTEEASVEKGIVTYPEPRTLFD